MIKTIQVEVIAIAIITILLLSLFAYLGSVVKKANITDKPKGILVYTLVLYDFIKGFTEGNMGKEAAKAYAPYIGSLALYLVVSNLSGLFGLTSPTTNYSVTLTLALITFIFVQYTKLKVNGIKGYLHGFIEPFPPFIIMNVFGLISPLISMSLRLFGNMTAGTVLMWLFYAFTAFLSSYVPVIGQLNFVGIAIAPLFHAYFDVFSGLIQTYIFISLTTIFIGVELPQEG
jgi:F-type H+-transporting ATPase subunit a